MAVYFISDLHLNLQQPAMTAGFLNYLKSLNDAERLYILGDFFEAWIGDDVSTPLNDAVEQGLKALSDSGCKLFIMHGNRDFLIGDAFCQRTGATLIDENTVIQLGDQQVLLLHGDHLCLDDVEYQKVRLMLRNPVWQADFLSKTIPERIEFAKQARDQSKASGQMKADDIMDVTQSAVDEALNQSNTRIMIHGHTHRPKVHEWELDGQQRQRWVLGDWSESQGWQIRWTESDGLQLSQFDLSH